ncbi:alpha/beta fold hydrolase [Nonomuraea sp. NPDC050790]|uniref:alpha/beta fold hydrolase n=1 Tax=Nonomuraea sp. NPDC050790 TaxID=3364371 RepID=UPI0037A2D3FD
MFRSITLALTLAATPTPAPDPALTWSPCPDDKLGMVCADVSVPVDWTKPGGRKITLKVGKLKATGPSEGSVFISYGGPGSPGIAWTQGLPPGRWDDLRKRMDLIVWDPRGYPYPGTLSTALKCGWPTRPTPQPPRTDAEFARLAETNRAFAEICRSTDPELFDNMSSADGARDLEAIRKAVGAKQMNYYGASYSGMLGQAYARLYPETVRTMALDGTWSHSPAKGWEAETEALARDNEASMRRYFTWAGKGAEKDWRRLLARADRSEIPARQQPGVAFTGEDLRALGLLLARRGQASWETLKQAVKAASAGDASGFKPERTRLNYPYSFPGVTECTEFPRPATRKEAALQDARLAKIAPNTGAAGIGTVRGMLTCVGWPTPVSNPPKPLPKGLPPLLGAGAWSESDAVGRVVEQVPGSAVIKHEGPGHTLHQFNACARAHLDRYLTDRVIPTDRTC